jgi:hypothetical protein
MTKHDFTGKSIKCDTWEQMLHLAKLAEDQGYREIGLNKCDFNDGAICFYVVHGVYLNNHGKRAQNVVTYSYFTNPPLPTEVVEVTGCGDCPFHSFRGESERNYCSIESKYETDKPLFTTCPLLTKSITIKLKQNDTERN